MALTLTCDGVRCTESLPMDTKPVGRIEQRYYCAGCAQVWDHAEAAIEAARLRLVEAFNVERDAILARAREVLGVLPDE